MLGLCGYYGSRVTLIPGSCGSMDVMDHKDHMDVMDHIDHVDHMTASWHDRTVKSSEPDASSEPE